MPANLENSAVATELERSVFITILKKDNAKECSNYHTVVLTSHANKVIFKILQASLQQNFQIYNLVLGKAEEPEIKLSTFIGSWRKQWKSRKISTSASLTTLKPLTVWIMTNCGKFFKRWE